MKRSKVFITVLSLLLFLTMIATTGCKLLSKQETLLNENDEFCPASSIVIDEEEASKLNSQLPIHLYFTDAKKEKLYKEIRYIPIEEARKSESALATIVVNELIKGPEKENYIGVMPENTQLRAPVRVDNRIAIVDLSIDFVDNHSGDKKEEELTIFSIANSLTELKDVDRVKFLIDGKPRAEFKGNFTFDEEFPRNEAIISLNLSE